MKGENRKVGGKNSVMAIHKQNPARVAAGNSKAAGTAERMGRTRLICALKIEYSGDMRYGR